MINDYYLVAFVVGIIVVMLLIQTILFICLKKRHPQTWKDIGTPSVLGSNSFKSGFLLTNFLWRKGYLKLKDPIINRIMQVFRAYLAFFLIAFVLLLSYEYFITGRLRNSFSAFLSIFKF